MIPNWRSTTGTKERIIFVIRKVFAGNELSDRIAGFVRYRKDILAMFGT
jgi:hypothetical protein